MNPSCSAVAVCLIVGTVVLCGCDQQQQGSTPRALGRQFEVESSPRQKRSLIDRARDPEDRDTAYVYGQPTPKGTGEQQANTDTVSLQVSRSLGALSLDEVFTLPNDDDELRKQLLDSRILDVRAVGADYKEHYDRGQEQFKRGEISRALASYEEAKALNPRNYAAYVGEADCHLANRDFGKALAAINFAIDCEPKMPELIGRRARVRIAQGDFQLAVGDLTKLLAEKPDEFEALLYRAQCYFLMNNFQSAIDDYTTAIKGNPNDLGLRLRRGVAYFHRRLLKESAADATYVIDRQAGVMQAHHLRSACLFQLGDLEGSRSDFEAAVRLGLDPSAAAQMRRYLYPDETPSKP